MLTSGACMMLLWDRNDGMTLINPEKVVEQRAKRFDNELTQKLRHFGFSKTKKK